MPSWWMPLSCANAFRPTIALLYWTGKLVTAETSREARASIVVLDAGVERHAIGPRLHRHHDLFQRRVACALADAVDGAFDLPCARDDTGQRVGNGETEVVVAVGREDRLVGIRHALAQHLEQRGVLFRHGVADGVGNVDGGGAGLDRRLDAAAQEIMLGAGRVLGRPLDILDPVARALHRRSDERQHFVLAPSAASTSYGRGWSR